MTGFAGAVNVELGSFFLLLPVLRSPDFLLAMDSLLLPARAARMLAKSLLRGSGIVSVASTASAYSSTESFFLLLPIISTSSGLVFSLAGEGINKKN